MERVRTIGVTVVIGGCLYAWIARPHATERETAVAAAEVEPKAPAQAAPQAVLPTAVQSPHALPSRTRAADTSPDIRAAVTPEERMARFFGEAAMEVAARFEREPFGDDAEQVEQRIERVFKLSDTAEMVRDVECRTSLCRIRVDWQMATNDTVAVRRLAGAFGADGWLLRDGARDLLAFVPSDFEPLRDPG